jgi:hypothetical protein
VVVIHVLVKGRLDFFTTGENYAVQWLTSWPVKMASTLHEFRGFQSE